MKNYFMLMISVLLTLPKLANNFALPGGESNPGLPRDRRGY